MAFATNEVHAGSNPAGRSISCAIVVTRRQESIDTMLRTFKRDIVRMTTKRVIWGVVS